MSGFVPNYHPWEVFNSFFHSRETAADAHQELHNIYQDAVLSQNNVQWLVLLLKYDYLDVDDRWREIKSDSFKDAELEPLFD